MADAAGVSRGLFERPVIAGRVVLSDLAPAALDAMPWLVPALAPEWSQADLEAAVADGTGVLIGDAAGAAIGVAVVRLEAPSAGSAVISFLAIDPGRRFRGLGGEAGLALDAQLRNKGFQRVYAPVPDGRGLAVYFWLRLGFRPLLQGESPGAVVGLKQEPMRGIWMLRGPGSE